jgi:hypothetical protein
VAQAAIPIKIKTPKTMRITSDGLGSVMVSSPFILSLQDTDQASLLF